MRKRHESHTQLAADALDIMSPVLKSSNVDSKIASLSHMRTYFGDQVIEVIKSGISRKVTPTVQDVTQLIFEWERSDPVCCFSGSVEELLSMKNTWILAVSFRHDKKDQWKRKGDGFTCKMMQRDQEALSRAIAGLSAHPNTDYVMIWCDRILATRSSERENSFSWYNAGLLPYFCLPVLTLSTHIPDDQLEQRLWIKVERSLGRMGQGLLSPADAELGICSNHGKDILPMEIAKNIALVILNGYWPKDTGHWAKDYEEMSMWAIGVLCRTDRIVRPPIFEEIEPADNMELLAILPDLVLLPRGVDFEEPPRYTDDLSFYLKAIAWNLSLRKVWKDSPNTVSHYMGRLCNRSSPRFRFSWWKERDTDTIFGCFETTERATVVLAVRHQNGYTVYRREGDPDLYHHAEAEAGIETKNLLEIAAAKCDVLVDLDKPWHLVYSCDEVSGAPLTHGDVRKAMGDASVECDAVVPWNFTGMTPSLYRAALALGVTSGRFRSTAELFLSIFDEWNSRTRENFDQFVSIRDAISGPVWLEGFNEHEMSFGFLDFLTHRLFTIESPMSTQMVSLPSKPAVVQNIKQLAQTSSNDLKVITEELFGSISEEGAEGALDTSDVARFMASGGFTAGIRVPQFTMFLCKSAQRRGYWRTDICAREGKVQVIFNSGSESVRIAQRRTDVQAFTAVGLVRPQDVSRVPEVSELLTDDRAVYVKNDFWKDGLADMPDGTHISDIYPHSCKNMGDGCVLNMVDMTVSSSEQKNIDICTVHDVYGASHAPDKKSVRAKVDELYAKFVKRDNGASSRVGEHPRTFEEASATLRREKKKQEELEALVNSVINDAHDLHRSVRQRQRTEPTNKSSAP